MQSCSGFVPHPLFHNFGTSLQRKGNALKIERPRQDTPDGYPTGGRSSVYFSLEEKGVQANNFRRRTTTASYQWSRMHPLAQDCSYGC